MARDEPPEPKLVKCRICGWECKPTNRGNIRRHVFPSTVDQPQCLGTGELAREVDGVWIGQRGITGR